MFRFQELEIWKKAVDIGNRLLDIADELEKKKLYRFADQIRGAGLSISNNTCQVLLSACPVAPGDGTGARGR